MCYKCFGGSGLGSPKKNITYEIRECAVCVGMEGDHTRKRVAYCTACGEWICDTCKPRVAARGILALKKLFKFT